LPRIISDRGLASRLVTQMAEILAELHACLPQELASQLAGPDHKWPPSVDWVRVRLPEVVADKDLLDLCLGWLEAFASLEVPDEERVLCHGDFGFHNFAFDAVDFSVKGIFDFDSASFNDPHWDLRYMVFGPTPFHYQLLDLGIETYDGCSGRTISRDRVLLYNAISAITFLAYRRGISAETVWCGRNLEEDLAWTRLAISKLD